MSRPIILAKEIDFVLVVALEEERDAVLDKLAGYRKLSPSEDDIRTYFQADLPVTFPDGQTGAYRVIVMPLLGMGRLQAATATANAIARWHPRYIVLVGIAGGVAARGVGIGDILIADQIVDYELQKLTPQGPQIRWEVHRADPRLLNACRNFMGESWQELVRLERPEQSKPQRHTGPIASGDKVIAWGDVLEQYREVWPKLIGVEMEAAGVATTAFQSSAPPGFFMVRCVSDLADEHKGSSDVEQWRAYACDAAASFAIALLKSGPIPLPDENKARIEPLSSVAKLSADAQVGGVRNTRVPKLIEWWNERGYKSDPFTLYNADDASENNLSEFFLLWYIDPGRPADAQGLGVTPTLDTVMSLETNEPVLIYAPEGGGKTFYRRWAARKIEEVNALQVTTQITVPTGASMSEQPSSRMEAAAAVPENNLISIQRQIAEARENLRLIQERKIEFVLSTDIPLQLIKEERRLMDRIARFEQQLTAQSSVLDKPGPPSASEESQPEQPPLQYIVEIPNLAALVIADIKNMTGPELALCIYRQVCDKFLINEPPPSTENIYHILDQCDKAIRHSFQHTQPPRRVYVFVDGVDQLFDDQPSASNQNNQALAAITGFCKAAAKLNEGMLALRMFLPLQLEKPIEGRLGKRKRIKKCIISWSAEHCQSIMERRLDSYWMRGPNTGVNHIERLLTSDARYELLTWLRQQAGISPRCAIRVLGSLTEYACGQGIKDRINVETWKEFAELEKASAPCGPDAAYPLATLD